MQTNLLTSFGSGCGPLAGLGRASVPPGPPALSPKARVFAPRGPAGSGRGEEGRGACASSRRWSGSEEAEAEDDEDFRDLFSSDALGLPAERDLPEVARIGAQYGEGFSHLGLDGKVRDLDVQSLNKQLRVLGAERMRHAMHPHEGYGMIFSWEGVLANTREVQRRAWQRLAKEEGLWFPPIERRAIYDVSPERAITEVLNWTRDWGLARKYCMKLAYIYAEELRITSEQELLVPGAKKWLEVLKRANVPCTVVTSMDRSSLQAQLERAGLWGTFSGEVTAEDGMETISELLLSAAIKMNRPPNRCVAYTSCPHGVAAAHNCTMKAIGLLGNHKSFELQSADVTVGCLSQLTIINIRRVFANAGSDFMDLSLQYVGDEENPPNKRRITNGLVEK